MEKDNWCLMVLDSNRYLGLDNNNLNQELDIRIQAIHRFLPVLGKCSLNNKALGMGNWDLCNCFPPEEKDTHRLQLLVLGSHRLRRVLGSSMGFGTQYLVLDSLMLAKYIRYLVSNTDLRMFRQACSRRVNNSWALSNLVLH